MIYLFKVWYMIYGFDQESDVSQFAALWMVYIVITAMRCHSIIKIIIVQIFICQHNNCPWLSQTPTPRCCPVLEFWTIPLVPRVERVRVRQGQAGDMMRWRGCVLVVLLNLPAGWQVLIALSETGGMCFSQWQRDVRKYGAWIIEWEWQPSLILKYTDHLQTWNFEPSASFSSRLSLLSAFPNGNPWLLTWIHW